MITWLQPSDELGFPDHLWLLFVNLSPWTYLHVYTYTTASTYANVTQSYGIQTHIARQMNTHTSQTHIHIQLVSHITSICTHWTQHHTHTWTHMAHTLYHTHTHGARWYSSCVTHTCHTDFAYSHTHSCMWHTQDCTHTHLVLCRHKHMTHTHVVHTRRHTLFYILYTHTPSVCCALKNAVTFKMFPSVQLIWLFTQLPSASFPCTEKS